MSDVSNDCPCVNIYFIVKFWSKNYLYLRKIFLNRMSWLLWRSYCVCHQYILGVLKMHKSYLSCYAFWFWHKTTSLMSDQWLTEIPLDLSVWRFLQKRCRLQMSWKNIYEGHHKMIIKDMFLCMQYTGGVGWFGASAVSLGSCFWCLLHVVVSVLWPPISRT